MKTNHETDTMTSGSDTKATLIERIVGDSVTLGRVWASYGLEAGRQVLASSAKSLELTAGMLDRLAQEFGETPARRAAASTRDESADRAADASGDSA